MRILPLLIMGFAMGSAYADEVMVTPITPSSSGQTPPTSTFPGTTRESNQPVNAVNPPIPRSLPNTPVSVQNPPDELNPPNQQNVDYYPLPPADEPAPYTYSPSTPGIGVVPKTTDQNNTNNTNTNTNTVTPPVSTEPIQQ